MRILIYFICILFIGCTYDDPATLNAKRILQVVTSADWSKEVNLDDLAYAIGICHERPIEMCDQVKRDAQAIADARVSCQNNGSSLCQQILRASTIKANAFAVFPPGKAMLLPDHPYYWRIGNKLLDARDKSFGFRREMWGRWYFRNRHAVNLVLAVFIFTALMILYRRRQIDHVKNEQEQKKRERNASWKASREKYDRIRFLAQMYLESYPEESEEDDEAVAKFLYEATYKPTNPFIQYRDYLLDSADGDAIALRKFVMAMWNRNIRPVDFSVLNALNLTHLAIAEMLAIHNMSLGRNDKGFRELVGEIREKWPQELV